ncbi:MAG TPA: adenylate kinase family protein [archaeon]|nr:adenylate kinase family protein [archaeon]
MRIAITGTPGVGKTAVAKRLSQFYNWTVLNEREFALREGIGEFDSDTNELVVPLEKLQKSLNKFLAKQQNAIIEGHLICEIKAKFDLVVVLRLNPERLEFRLEQRGYGPEKIQDNVFCEGIDYCLKHAKRNYPKIKVFELENRKTIKDTTDLIIREIENLMKK